MTPKPRIFPKKYMIVVLFPEKEIIKIDLNMAEKLNVVSKK